MKQYLKMVDVFRDEMRVVGDSKNMLADDVGIIIGCYSGDKMAEYVLHAINSHDELVQMNQELLAALEGLLDIVGDSDSVSGYHLNGDIAEWGEFEELNAAYDAVNKANGGAAK